MAEVSVTTFKHPNRVIPKHNQKHGHTLKLKHLQRLYQISHHWDLRRSSSLSGLSHGLEGLFGDQLRFLFADDSLERMEVELMVG